MRSDVHRLSAYSAIKDIFNTTEIDSLPRPSQAIGAVMSSDDPVAESPSGHLRKLGRCWLAYGVIRLIMTVCLFIYSGMATLMFVPCSTAFLTRLR